MVERNGLTALVLSAALVVGSGAFCARAQSTATEGPNAAARATPGPETAERGYATGAELEQIQARRKILFQLMLADTTNLDVAFEYAGLSARAGDFEAAIGTLERMLIYAPGLPRLQLELGVLYYRLGAYETARTYLQAALDAPDIPAVVQERVDPYLRAIDKRTKGYSFGGTLSAGVRYQTNANAGPGGTVTLNGFPATLDNEATGTPDVNGFASANLTLSIDLKNQGDRFDINLVTYGAWYDERTDLDTALAEVKLGPVIDLERFGIRDAALGLYAIGSGLALEEEPYLAAGGAGSSYAMRLFDRGRLFLQGEYRHEEYFNSDRRATASLRSGDTFTGDARLAVQLTERFSIFAALEGERRLTERDFYDYWELGASGGWQVAMDSPFKAQREKWVFGMAGGLVWRDFDAPDPFINAAEREHDDEQWVTGTLTVPVADGWALQGQGGYRNVDSNYDTRVFDNIHTSASVLKKF